MHDTDTPATTSPLNIAPGQKGLVTLDNWFYAPNGRQYRAVFGTVKAARTAEDTLGVKPNGKSTNWYLEIGNVTIAGCQIHYVVRCDAVATDSHIEDYTVSAEHGLKEFKRPNTVYMADEVLS